MHDFTVDDFIKKNAETPYCVKHSNSITLECSNTLTINYYTEPNNNIFNTKYKIYHIIEIKDENNMILFIDIIKKIFYRQSRFSFDYLYIYEKNEYKLDNCDTIIFFSKNIIHNINIQYMKTPSGGLRDLIAYINDDGTYFAYYDVHDFVEQIIQIKMSDKIIYNYCIKQHNDQMTAYAS